MFNVFYLPVYWKWISGYFKLGFQGVHFEHIMSNEDALRMASRRSLELVTIQRILVCWHKPSRCWRQKRSTMRTKLKRVSNSRKQLRNNLKENWGNPSFFLPLGTLVIFVHFFKIFIYLHGGARFYLRHMGSFPDQGSNPGPLHWEHRVLATGQAEESHICTF